MRLEIRVYFSPKDLVERLKESPHIVEEELGNAVEDLMMQTYRRAQKKVPVNTGLVKQSLAPGHSMTLTKRKGVRAVVGSRVYYAPYLEFGTRPHWPPVSPLRDWVWKNRRKFGIGSGQGALRQVDRIAFLVGRSIARRGTKEHRFLRGALEEVQGKAKRTVQYYADRIVERVTGK